jgi:hypothetical protein
MLPTSSQPGQAADVVQLLPPQIPAFLLGSGRQSFSYPPASTSCNTSSTSQPFWRQQEATGQQQLDQVQQQQRQDPLQQAVSSSKVSNNTSSRRRTPTANGSSPGPSFSSSHAGRAPIDIVLRGITAGGIGAGAGGMVSLHTLYVSLAYKCVIGRYTMSLHVQLAVRLGMLVSQHLPLHSLKLLLLCSGRCWDTSMPSLKCRILQGQPGSLYEAHAVQCADSQTVSSHSLSLERSALCLSLPRPPDAVAII